LYARACPSGRRAGAEARQRSGRPAAGFKNRKIFHSFYFLRADGIFLKNGKENFADFGLRSEAKAEAALSLYTL